MNNRTGLTAAIVLALTGSLATVASSAGPRRGDAPLPQVTVRYGDLDLNTDAGALALYERITTAARKVCDTHSGRDLHVARTVRECREAAIERAVAAMGNARLAAIRNAHLTGIS